MPKEKAINPAQAQRRAEKAKAIKKGKASTQALRNEKLAKRNPTRLEAQLAELQALEKSGAKLTSHEKTQLEGLEREIKGIRRAREALGDRAPVFRAREREREGRGGGVLGKRRRGGEESSGEEEIDEEVQRIPMPRDTPPPFSKEVLDAWYAKRRERAAARNSEGGGGGGHGGGGANQIPLGQNDRRARLGLGLETRDRDGDGKKEEEKIERPKLEAKTVYEAKPAIRDLRKEAITFVPAAVRVKIEKGKGVGGLVEPEEADRLEIEGYLGGRKNQGEEGQGSRTVQIEEVDDEEG